MSAKKTTPDQTTPAATEPIKDLADVLAIEVIRTELPGLVRARVRELLTSNRPEDRAKLQEVLQQIGFVIAAEALSDCLKAAVSASQRQLSEATP